MDPHLHLSAHRWPIVEWVYPARADIDQIRATYVEWEGLFSRGPHAILVDTRHLNPLTVRPTLRKAMAAEVEKRRPVFERHLVAEARVITDPMTRGMVTAFDWIVGDTFSRPLRNVATYEDADAFLSAELRKKGLLGAGSS